MAYKLISSGDIPVQVADFKQAINFNLSGKDESINLFLKAATAEAELFTGRGFRNSVWELQLTEFPESVIIEKSPVTGVSSVIYFNELDEETAMVEGTDYIVDTVSNPAVVRFEIRPAVYAYRSDAIKITFATGYPDGLPEDVTAAIFMAAGSYLLNPADSVRQFPTASRNLLRNHRLFL